MEGAGSLSEALEGGAAFGALQGLVQTWVSAAVMDNNLCAFDCKAREMSVSPTTTLATPCSS